MTEAELQQVFQWYEEHSYSAKRPDAEKDTLFTCFLYKKDPISKGSQQYREWYTRFMARCYLNPDHSETEPSFS